MSSFPEEFLRALNENICLYKNDQFRDLPNYFLTNPTNSLVSRCQISGFELGTCSSILSREIFNILVNAHSEIVLVTCFWSSNSIATSFICQVLNNCAKIRSSDDAPLHVHICLSSLSFTQKFFSRPPRQRKPKIYTARQTVRLLGLPDPNDLQCKANIYLHVRSLFFPPFSVLHSKYIIVDRCFVLVPSFNISWEPFFETAISLSGPVVEAFVKFYQAVWSTVQDSQDQLFPTTSHLTIRSPQLLPIPHVISPLDYSITLRNDQLADLPCILLPSSHHQNPHIGTLLQKVFATSRIWTKPDHFKFFPPTPLTLAMKWLISEASRNIFIQTPNLNSLPALKALIMALSNGVNIIIITNRNMMFLEQIITGGAWTGNRGVRSLISAYNKLRSSIRSTQTNNYVCCDNSNSSLSDTNERKIGMLRIAYFTNRGYGKKNNLSNLYERKEIPTHTHMKLLLVDDVYSLFGSVNMDHASWFTSQEIGLLIYSTHLVKEIHQGLLSAYFASSPDRLRELESENLFNANIFRLNPWITTIYDSSER